MKQQNAPLVVAAFVAACSLSSGLLCAKPLSSFDQFSVLVETHCVDCHGASEPEANFNLARFDTQRAVRGDLGAWRKALTRLRNGEMPPEDASDLSLKQREQMIEWIEAALRSPTGAEQIAAGPAPLRRLNRNEYRTTMRDLLGIHIDAAHGLPADGAGGAGFNNAAETLFLSPVHAEKYLQAAREALEYAGKDSAARELLFIRRPDEKTSAEQAAREVLRQFATRAFRRPVEDEELERLMSLFETANAEGGAFEEAVFYAMQAVLISPHFLFRVETIRDSAAPYPVSDYELAVRLSYFLWSSMPDEELMELAEQGELHEEQTLREQTIRLLENRKARAFVESFIGQWLGTRELGGEFQPDPKVFPRFNNTLQAALRYEPVYFFEEILQDNRSLLELIDADYVFVNQELIRHYDVPKDAIKKRIVQRLERVDLPKSHPRGGVLTMGAVLAVSSYPDRTSPVLRGKWVLETLLGTPPPPPPPDAGELSQAKEDVEGKTLRERLVAHRRDPKCASCHERLDPLGFGLENFDAIGRWRDKDAGEPIDASGQLPDGASFASPQELKQVLLERKEDFLRHLAEKTFSYAIGRGLVNSDYPVVEGIVQRVLKNECRSRELILGIVMSDRFRYRPGNANQQTP